MNVKLITATPNIEETIVSIARVSSSRKDKTAEPHKLINYLIKNYHLSPFEHGYITLEIETSKAIGIQLLRHRSFTFQEFSQRYQDVSKLDTMFQDIELRQQAKDNRQSSTKVFDPQLDLYTYFAGLPNGDSLLASEAIKGVLDSVEDLYLSLLENGVARETARMILPMTTTTKLYMTGNVRSWLGFLNVRLDHHAQKEIRLLSLEIANILKELCPNITAATADFGNFGGMFLK